MSLTLTTQANQIRQNRSRMRQNLKLNKIQHEKMKNQGKVTHVETSYQQKTNFKLQVIRTLGLVQKEYLHGQFEDSYDLKQKIGEGAHATVYRCTQKSTGKNFAVKITKHGDQELIVGSKVQYKILKNLDHKNIMKAEAFYTDQAKLTTYMVCELCDYPQLAIYLRNRKHKYLPEAQATTIVNSILKTLQYLHQKGVCHRDIKPENILYDPENKCIKMIDFDCAMLKKQAKFEMWTKTGSFHYQAPEYFCSTVYDEKVDLWAVGVIAYELVSGLLPFNCIYYNRMIKMITENEADIHSLKVSDDFKLMLSKMLEKNPNKRYTASQCLRLPLLLKEEQISISKALDDFNIKLKQEIKASPISSTQIGIRNNQTTTCGKNSPLILLKYFCFVTDP